MGNCLKKFMELFDVLSDFLSDKLEMKHLLTVDGKAFVSYLTDIFGKLNMLNKQLQGSNKTLIDAKTKTFVFVTFIEYQEELSEMQTDDTVKTLFNIKGVMSWLCDEIETKYVNSTNFARKLLLFQSSYLAEYGCSAVNDLLLKKRNWLDITKRGDLRLKLTKLVPNIKFLRSRHEAQGSH
ncbi:uncharacterized protein LOC115216179 [Octopus sinensis]|uniref:Uncharacterized protein LOC115216179 n=1 Tax=Octopus sinensis TaxID=2607531 RepID=A0A6P7SST2_9MOLL|nr:uncharacterized protein LOC115216179 [Octopus sinensis]